jgi:sulfur carrier protein ThiS
VTLEKAGVPSIAVVTEPFGFKARAEVGALGLGNLPIQILPHPIGQISDEAMRALTDEAYDEVLFSLTSPAAEVAAAYEGSVTPRSGYSR